MEYEMNNKKLFVGNLTYSVRDVQLIALFSRYGEVVSVNVIEKKGYGFVEMRTPEQAEIAREALNETELEGRNLLIDGIRPPLQSKKGPSRPGMGGQEGRTPRQVYKPGNAGSGYRGKKPSPHSRQRTGRTEQGPRGSGQRRRK
jgi:RNA recognition motif-containing protein